MRIMLERIMLETKSCFQIDGDLSKLIAIFTTLKRCFQLKNRVSKLTLKQNYTFPIHPFAFTSVMVKTTE